MKKKPTKKKPARPRRVAPVITFTELQVRHGVAAFVRAEEARAQLLTSYMEHNRAAVERIAGRLEAIALEIARIPRPGPRTR
jgi:hypothetical protein